MALSRLSLLLTSLFISGCYPIEKVYVLTTPTKVGEEVITISRIKLDSVSKSGVFLRHFSGPAYAPEKGYSKTDRAERSSIEKLDKCLIVDEVNWQCKWQDFFDVTMLDGELSLRVPGIEAHYKTHYRVSF